MTIVEFYDDPAAFLDVAAGYLAADAVLTTVVSSVTQDAVAADRRGDPRPGHHRWWAVARDDDGGLAGVAMRTAPFEPYPLFVLPLPDDAALLLARTLHERGEQVGGVNGALPAVGVMAAELARLQGGQAEVHEHVRLFELPALIPPTRRPAGELRLATEADLDLCFRWFESFVDEADRQAGRPVVPRSVPRFGPELVAQRIADGRVWLWEVDGVVVHLTAANPPAHGVARVGPVFTPTEHRGHGYAGAAVHDVSRAVLDAGDRACLFTDQANPVSNRIYEALGYRRVVDMANYVVTTPAPA